MLCCLQRNMYLLVGHAATRDMQWRKQFARPRPLTFSSTRPHVPAESSRSAQASKETIKQVEETQRE